MWLADMGALVYGYSLAPVISPNFFKVVDVQSHIVSSVIGDIRDKDNLFQALTVAKPEVIFHLAAQPLVLHSYLSPLETYDVNIMGTAYLFELVRHLSTVKCIVNVTTDKCYANHDRIWPYRESDHLGGHDPYSSSKACSELVTAAYQKSFFSNHGIYAATARAGNVIGGGDWSPNRLLPDVFRSLDLGEPLSVRCPSAVRPWQHVLEPLSGYILLAEKLYTSGSSYTGPWNFGPPALDMQPVQWILQYLSNQLPSFSWNHKSASLDLESQILRLDSSKANYHLGWNSSWNIQTALDKTLSWHEAYKSGNRMSDHTLHQIGDYLDS